LADYRVVLEGSVIEVNIDYKNEEGLRLYPEPLYIRKVNVSKYPIQNASGTKVYVIPICDLSTTPDTKTKYVPYDINCPKCNKEMSQNLHGLAVSYQCSNCGTKSHLEWEIDKPKPTAVIETTDSEPFKNDTDTKIGTLAQADAQDKEKKAKPAKKHVDKQSSFM
jgi:DNA-directed RNA polymerase subunit RPC12/RpoP